MHSLENLKKELIYRSCHRGCKETDILLGDFAVQFIPQMNQSEIYDYRDLVAQEDVMIYSWLTDQEPFPTTINNTLLNKIKAFHENKKS